MLQSLASLPLLRPFKRALRWSARHWPFPVRARTLAGQALYVDLRSGIGQGILVTGEFDPRVFDPIGEVLRPGDAFLDVGANVGYYATLASAAVGGQGLVHAVEIDPRSLACLRRTLRLPEYGNVRLHEVAAGEVEGEVNFSLGKDCGHSRLDPKAGTLVVRVQPLDTFIDLPEGAVLRAMKIDIEGAELPALRGARKLLERHRPLLVAECDPKLQVSFGYGTADLVAFLERLGYDVGWIEGTHSPTLVARHGWATARDHPAPPFPFSPKYIRDHIRYDPDFAIVKQKDSLSVMRKRGNAR